MTLLLLALLLYAGISTDRMRWPHFGWMAGIAIVGTLISSALRNHERALQGRDGQPLLEPANLAGNMAINFTLFCLAYLLGRALRRILRRPDK